MCYQILIYVEVGIVYLGIEKKIWEVRIVYLGIEKKICEVQNGQPWKSNQLNIILLGHSWGLSYMLSNINTCRSWNNLFKDREENMWSTNV